MNCLVLSVMLSLGAKQCEMKGQDLISVGMDPKDPKAMVVQCSKTTYFVRDMIDPKTKHICLEKRR